MTIAQALLVSDRTVSFRDAEVLLADVLKVERVFLHTHPEKALTAAQTKKYEEFLLRREQNEPVAYITGHKEFYGRDFQTDQRALIPRPETEALIEYAVNYAQQEFMEHTTSTSLPCPVRIAELGTGCGCIGITLALELASHHVPATIIASEIATEALELAKNNWQILSQNQHLGNIQLHFVEADLFKAPVLSDRPFDLIIANLPYVEDTWKMNPAAQPDVVFHEPDIALFGGGDGLDIYRRFFAEVSTHLTDHGRIIIEYGGETQSTLLLPIIAQHLPHKTCVIHQDYAGLDRVIEIS